MVCFCPSVRPYVRPVLKERGDRNGEGSGGEGGPDLLRDGGYAETGLNLGDEGVYECNRIGVDAGERPQDILQGLAGLDGLVNVVRREHGLQNPLGVLQECWRIADPVENVG